jgi:hypothetical protein
MIDVLQWNIVTTYDDSWDVVGGGTTIITAGSTIIVKLDDTTWALSAWKNGSIELAEGPNLFFGYNGSATLATIAPFFQKCQGTTLRQVGTNNSYPYGTLGSNANNSECQIAPTCDLEIASNYVITPATGPGVPDGSIVGTGTSSNGLIKYSFDPDFEYGDPFPLFALPPLVDWTSINLSSEPMVWATGANPVCTVTHPTLLVPALSDMLSPGVMSFTPGVTYRYSFEFTVNAPLNQYVWIRVLVADTFHNIIASKILAKSNFATSLTTVLTGDFQFVGTAAMVYLGIKVEATGGSLDDFDVTVDSFSDNSGTPSGPGVEEELNFTGLLPGDYTIYAKDAAGCQDTISFTIPVTTTYGVRYRLEYRDKLRGTSYKLNRLDILQRAYDGEIEEICGGETPVKIRYEGDRDDPNVPIVASNATIELLVETSGQFNDMFLSDDRKYLVKHYIGSDFDSLQLYWTGYIVPEFHSEPYIFEPYPLTITASDGIGELKNKDFTDINENNFKGDMKSIKIISEALKKTGLELLILQGINVFDENMDEDGDPLDQAYVDSRIYYNKRTPVKSDVALKSIIDPFRAQIFQSKGVWWVIRLSDAVGTFPYRIFDFNGEYAVDVGAELDAELDVDLGGGLSPSGTINALFELDFPSAIHPEGKAMFARKTQLLTFVRNYGYFEIKHNLKKDGNLIDTGAFESEDIIQLASGNHTFKDWNVLIGQAGVKYGHETVVNGDSTGAFYFDFVSAFGNQVDTQLYSAAMPLDSVDGRIRLRFQYFVTPEYNVPYIRIAWTLKFRMVSDGTYRWLTYATNGAITYDFIEQKNDIYVTQYDKWDLFDLLTEIPSIGVADAFEISFFLHDHKGRDFEDITALKAFDPSTLSNPNGSRRMVAGLAGETNVYTAEYSVNDPEDLPKIVHPDSYNAGDGDHRWIWRLDKIINVSENSSLVRRMKFDNVSLAFYPLVQQPIHQYIDPPETLSYSEETDKLVIPNFTKEVMLGDMIRFDTTLTRNEKNLYRGYFRLEDGTPTQNWHRLGVDESKRLLQILLEDYRDQFKLPQRRLSGLKITTEVLHFVNCLRDNVDGTRYRPMTFEFDTKNAMYTPDMSGVLAGETGEPPLVVGEFDPEEFSDDFNTGE